MQDRTVYCLKTQELAISENQHGVGIGSERLRSSRRLPSETSDTGVNTSARSDAFADLFGDRATMALRGTVCSIALVCHVAGVGTVKFVDPVANALVEAITELDQGGGFTRKVKV